MNGMSIHRFGRIALLAAAAVIGGPHIAQGHVGVFTPEDAFVAVDYRDHWFWIDDRELVSKRSFSLMMLLFTLADTGEKESLPLITIPAQ